MATTSVTVTGMNAYPVDTASAPTLGGTGTWAAGTVSFMVVAGFNGATSYSNTKLCGWPLDTQANWNGLVIGVGDTGKQVTLTWTHGTAIPDYYHVFYQIAASYDLTAAGMLCASVVGTLQTATFSEPSGAAEVTLGSAYSYVTLDPIDLAPIARQSADVGFDGYTTRRSFARNSLFEALGLLLYNTSCSAADHKYLLAWSLYNTKVRVTDLDTNSFIQYWDGRLHLPTQLGSEGKQSGRPGFTLMVESETIR